MPEAREYAVGPGRGSAAGSLVSYTALASPSMDPIRYNLLFERFLNPERVSMPDIDVDFCFERRQEVIDYVVRKYGKDRVAQIVTFGTLAARGVIRDVGRVMDLSYAMVDSIAKMIPSELNITIDKALKANNDLKQLYDNDEQVKKLIDMSRRLEGLPRHTSMHAAGVVISQKSVDEYVPLIHWAGDGSITTQFTMTTLEELGLLKMDFLGLRTLTVIQNAVRLAEKSTGKTIDIDKIDYDDKAVLAFHWHRKDGRRVPAGKRGDEKLHEGAEAAEPGGCHCRNFPVPAGPDGFYSPVYRREKTIRKASSMTAPSWSLFWTPPTGVSCYQEQVMQIVRNLAGYTLGTKRPGAPRHVQEKGGGDGKGAPELCLRKSKKRACQAALPMASAKRWPTRFTMR